MWKQIIKAVLGILCVAIIAELVLRMLAGFSQNIRFFTTNPYQQTYLAEDTGWKGVVSLACSTFMQYPKALLNGFVFNSHGFESPEYPYQKPKNTKRIVFLGDSQTVGAVPYPKGFVRVLESRFQSEQQNIQAINLGIICVGPRTEKQVLKYEGILFQPDIVVFGFFVGNDFEDDKGVQQAYNENKRKTYLFPFWVYQSKLYSLIRNVHIYLTVGKKSPLLQKVDSKEVGIDIKYGASNESQPVFSESDYIDLEKRKIGLFSQTSDMYSTLNSVQDTLLEMKQLTEKNNAHFLVLIIPDELQINKTLQEQISENKRFNQTDITTPQHILKTFFDQQNIQYIDLLNEWISSPSAETYFLPRNTHLSIEGNQAVADILYPELQKLLQ